MDTHFKCKEEMVSWKKNFQVNNVVLLVSSDSHRAHWPLSHVIKVYPGKDGQIHLVKLQVGDRQLVRPVVKLCPLELNCSVWIYWYILLEIIF